MVAFPMKHQTLGNDQIFEKRFYTLHRELNIKEKSKIHAFKFSNVNKSIDIQLSNDNKTATKITSNAWKTVLGDTPFPPSNSFQHVDLTVQRENTNLPFKLINLMEVFVL